MEAFSPYVEWEIGGLRLAFDIPTMIMSVIVALLVLLILRLGTRNMTSGVPRGWQNFFEWVIDFVKGIGGQFMDAKTTSKFVTLALTLFLYIFLANQVGLLFTTFHIEFEKPVESIGITEELIEEAKEHGEEGVLTAWWKSPTANPSVTFALALMVLIYSHYLGIKKNPRAYVKHYFEPYPALFIIHFLEDFVIKVLTLPLRLFGNIFAGEVLILFLAAGFWAATSVPLIIWLGYSVFVGAIQAYIFVTLTLVYISQKVSDHH
ncbi:F0F1 ATP synthase subunit A [Microaerobacter geothermalis]|uniref:F0F1 ATP synthase subunit A n=1 Tax=Microaerobacter geothermalis TaxID=674972 RepID=UPI001F47F35B|nr:F0F1 ATP synthase subunit A [Microaerobacter geothermalis]MCF6093220.1 F0F1 ATP synthase subunit A [Microaerobacter geothermalis]